MALDSYEQERVYKEGYVAGYRKLPKSGNPYAGNDDKEPVWDLGWDRGNSGKEYDGYA